MKAMFRKFILSAALALIGTSVVAQNVYDALRYSEQYSEGTARSVAMGNAFVALGGDMGAFSLNPASSAVYRYSEIVFTPSITVASNTSDYLGSSQSSSKVRPGIANIGFVTSVDTGRESTGLISWSAGVVFNKQNNYTFGQKVYGKTDKTSWLSSLAYDTDGIYAPSMDMGGGRDPFYQSAAGWNSILAWNNSLLDTLPGTDNAYIAATENLDGNDISVGGMLHQNYKCYSVGNVTEAVLNWAGNFSNKLYVGVNLGIQSISYEYEELYGEEAHSSMDFNSGFRYFSQGYRYHATGTGVNLKAGAIYVPAHWVRLGASISTPTWMYLDEEWENGMNSEFDDGYSQNIISPLGTYNYQLNTPFRWNVGAAFVLGDKGVISADYESADYSRAKFRDMDYEFGYDEENSYISQVLGKQNIVRVGAELNASPVCALRAGWQYYSSPYKDGASSDATQLISFGAGYVFPRDYSDFFIDIAYQQRVGQTEEKFSLYGDTDIAAPVGTSKNSTWKLLLSVGFRF